MIINVYLSDSQSFKEKILSENDQKEIIHTNLQNLNEQVYNSIRVICQTRINKNPNCAA